MKKKQKQPVIQKPLVIAGIFLVLIVILAVAVQDYSGDGVVKVQPTEEKTEVRAGTQVASITILPKDGTPTGEGESSPATEGSEEPERASRTTGPDSTLIAGKNVTFAIDRFQKLATQPLKLNIFDDNDVELGPDYLETIRGAKVHFFLVHHNMKLFRHILADYRNSVWNASANMPWAGTYYAYVMVDPLRGDPVTYRYDLVVRSESPEDEAKADPTLSANAIESSRYSATMEMKRFDDYRGFLYDVQKDGQPVVVTPHNDALGEMTLFSHKDPSFMRVATADVASQEGLGKISFSMANLPVGRYTAFMEVMIDGQIRTFAHTFDIGQPDDDGNPEEA
ncbi:hypothetical protein KC725_05910 [Candidatus Peregrinibacteria bacterium]|nr:hypothetical protein [Candidatus Peregrinibacteria bacterium]